MALAEVFRGLDDNSDDMRAAVAIGAHQGNAVTRELERGAGLSAGGDFHADITIDGFNIDFGAKCCVNHRNDTIRENDIPFASEALMWLDADKNVEIAFGTAFGGCAAFAAKTDRHAIINTSRDFDFEIFAISGDDLGSAEDCFFKI